MKQLVLMTTLTLLLATGARGDGLLFGYEGDILPGDPSFGFDIFNACEPDCAHRLEDGHLVLEWGVMGDFVNYHRSFAEIGGVLPPPTLWVEWRHRSNQPVPCCSSSCDSRFRIKYRGASDIAFPFQNAVVDQEGGDAATGLDPDIFHTHRFESLDGQNYTFAVDGVVWNTDIDTGLEDIAFIQFGGDGGCSVAPDRPIPVRNEWDFIRYGAIAPANRSSPPTHRAVPSPSSKRAAWIRSSSRLTDPTMPTSTTST